MSDRRFRIHGLHRTLTLEQIWFWSFLSLAGALSASIVWKIAGFQYLEVVAAVQILLLLVHFGTAGLRTRMPRICFTLMVLYGVFIAISMLLALLALRRDFYIPPNVDRLKMPIWITLSRTTELILDGGIMLYLIHVFRERQDALIYTMKVYFGIGVLGAIYSVVCYPFNVLYGWDLGTAQIDHRMRGFFNEGGPYGLYVASVFLVGYVLDRMQVCRRFYLRSGMALALICVLGSKSKAALVGCALLFISDALLIQGFRSRVAVVLTLVVATLVILRVTDVRNQLENLRRSAAAYERISNLHSHDGNVVIGRVAGFFIVPRMVAAHPWVGVGWGNYGLVRNDPTYRGASAWAFSYDEAALGLGDNAAELGIPLTLFLLFCLAYPFLVLSRWKAPIYVRNLALWAPMVHVCGGQLNLTYPWILSAFALGVGYAYRRNPVLSAAQDGSPWSILSAAIPTHS